MIPIAHAGHWAVDVLYAAPILVVIFVIASNVIRDRRASRDEDRKSGSGTE